MNAEQVAQNKDKFDETVDKVLSSGRYWRFNNNISKQAKSWLKAFQEWLEQLLNDRIDGIENAEGISKALTIAFVIVIGIILAAALFFLIRYIYRKVNDKKRIKEILGERITRKTTPMTLNESARQYEEKGAYRLSIRYRYIALLLLMHEKKVIFIKDAMTNLEIYEYLQKADYGNLTTFHELMETFNYVWYGQNECDQQAYSQFKDNLDRLWNEVV